MGQWGRGGRGFSVVLDPDTCGGGGRGVRRGVNKSWLDLEEGGGGYFFGNNTMTALWVLWEAHSCVCQNSPLLVFPLLWSEVV